MSQQGPIAFMWTAFSEVKCMVGGLRNLQSYAVYIGGNWFGVGGPAYIDELRISSTARGPLDFARAIMPTPPVSLTREQALTLLGDLMRIAEIWVKFKMYPIPVPPLTINVGLLCQIEAEIRGFAELWD